MTNSQGCFVPKFQIASPVRYLAVFLAAGCLASGAGAQNRLQNTAQLIEPSTGPTGASAASTGGDPASPDADVAFLARASDLYYSSSKAGLRGFDCQVHPDWHSLFISAEQDPPSPTTIRIQRAEVGQHHAPRPAHRRSSLDWKPPAGAPAKPLNPDLADLLNSMHQGLRSTLHGFMQFWSPFIDGSVIPATPDGLQITHSLKGHTPACRSGRHFAHRSPRQQPGYAAIQCGHQRRENARQRCHQLAAPSASVRHRSGPPPAGTWELKFSTKCRASEKISMTMSVVRLV